MVPGGQTERAQAPVGETGESTPLPRAGTCWSALSGRKYCAKPGGTAGVLWLLSLQIYCKGQELFLSLHMRKEPNTMANETKIPYKIYLEESEMPQAWYNVRADMKNKPAPLLNPGTLQPMTAQELGGVFCCLLYTSPSPRDTR